MSGPLILRLHRWIIDDVPVLVLRISCCSGTFEFSEFEFILIHKVRDVVLHICLSDLEVHQRVKATHAV